MNIYLIRHTKPKVKKGTCYGQTDLDVAESFYDESEFIRTKVGHIKFDKVFSSPLQRCSKLADTLFYDKVVIDERLKELNFGDWEMKKWTQIPRRLIDRWGADWVDEIVPNGESFRQQSERMISFLEELKSQDLQNVAVVTHSGPMRSARVYNKNIPMNKAFDIQLKYGEIMVLRF